MKPLILLALALGVLRPASIVAMYTNFTIIILHLVSKMMPKGTYSNEYILVATYYFNK